MLVPSLATAEDDDPTVRDGGVLCIFAVSRGKLKVSVGVDGG